MKTLPKYYFIFLLVLFESSVLYSQCFIEGKYDLKVNMDPGCIKEFTIQSLIKPESLSCLDSKRKIIPKIRDKKSLEFIKWDLSIKNTGFYEFTLEQYDENGDFFHATDGLITVADKIGDCKDEKNYTHDHYFYGMDYKVFNLYRRIVPDKIISKNQVSLSNKKIELLENIKNYVRSNFEIRPERNIHFVFISADKITKADAICEWSETTKDYYLLFDKNKTAKISLEEFAFLVAHEMAHIADRHPWYYPEGTGRCNPQNLMTKNEAIADFIAGYILGDLYENNICRFKVPAKVIEKFKGTGHYPSLKSRKNIFEKGFKYSKGANIGSSEYGLMFVLRGVKRLIKCDH